MSKTKLEQDAIKQHYHIEERRENKESLGEDKPTCVDYYFDKPHKEINDLPGHLPANQDFKEYHTRMLPRLQDYYKNNFGQ